MATVKELKINGDRVPVEADSDRMLLGVLRDDLDLTGAKYGCGEGRCGACTVLLDGKAVRSCVTTVGETARAEITTVEGLERGGKLHPLQAAFLERQALQCGFCTCGMIVQGVSLLKENPRPSTEEIARAMDGNVCRCGTYPRIVAAIQSAARAMTKEVAR